MRLSTRRFALAVGTVEPCKNYRLLLEVWRHLLLERDFDLDLVLVGREGHAATEIVMMLRQSPVLQERVHWLPQLADSELAALYNGCHIFVCPNLEESAPLPISEALAHRRVVLCSDRVSLPTSIHERLTRLDPLDAQRWRAAIREAATASPAEVYAEKLPTWDSCAAQVRDELLALAEAG